MENVGKIFRKTYLLLVTRRAVWLWLWGKLRCERKFDGALGKESQWDCQSPKKVSMTSPIALQFVTIIASLTRIFRRLYIKRYLKVYCWDGEEMKEKVVVLRELDRAIIYNE
jgi:hypothetical protein